MDLLKRTIHHIKKTAEIPSFSSYEERLHPYIHNIFEALPHAKSVDCPGNSLIWHIPAKSDQTVALTAHLDKINHYGTDHTSKLPVKVEDNYIEGAMDDSCGLGIVLGLAEFFADSNDLNLLIFLSGMEESKGLKDHPERLKNNGHGYESGMGAKSIAEHCIANDMVPDEIITVDTTPLFKGDRGVALYSKHWELNELIASEALIQKTEEVVQDFKSIDASIKLDNNTNDYLHYGKIFNEDAQKTVTSVALEPSIFPYHQTGEKVFIDDIERVLKILSTYLTP